MDTKSPNVWQKFWKRITGLWGQFLGTIDGLIGNKFVEFLNKSVPAPLKFIFYRDTTAALLAIKKTLGMGGVLFQNKTAACDYL